MNNGSKRYTDYATLMARGPRFPQPARARASDRGACQIGHHSSERGSAVLEFLVVFGAFLVPLIALVLTMAVVQRAMLGTSSAAREAGRVFVTAGSDAAARERALVAAAEVMANYGLGDPNQYSVRLRSRCAGWDACAGGFGPGAAVEVTVVYRVPVARRLRGLVPVELPVRSVHRTGVDGLRGSGP